MNETNYEYCGNDIIQKGEPNIKSNEEIQILTYRIVGTNSTPFLMYYLYRDDDNSLNLGLLPDATLDIGKIAESHMNKVLEKWSGDVVYKGYIQDNKTIILCLEYTDTTLNTNHGKFDDRWWWVIASEITNSRKVLTMQVDIKVTRLFERYSDLLYLKNDLNRKYETPTIGYYGNYANRIAVSTVIGHRKEPPWSIRGPYYYFGNYEMAARYALWSASNKPVKIDGQLITNNEHGRYIRGGIVRYALFLGRTNMEIIANNDYQQMMKNLANPAINVTESENTNVEWIYNYDSVIDGKNPTIPFSVIDKDNQGAVTKDQWIDFFGSDIGYDICDLNHDGKVTESEWHHSLDYMDKIKYRIVVKDYDQQQPLGYYYVDTSQDTCELEKVQIE